MPLDLISLIVPTRGRPALLRRLLDGLAETTAVTEALEVILVIDHDDRATADVSDARLALRRVIVPPGLTMGALNCAGYQASRGRYLMLLNDDVTPRTRHWDAIVRSVFAAHPDDIVLVHVNDLVMQRHLCTFPIVSRTFCELTGGLCPREYRRYRIDDHIEDHFNLLNLLGLRRTVFAPEVLFEHDNYTTSAGGRRQYFCDPLLLAPDAELYDRLFAQRKAAALRLMSHVTGRPVSPRWRRKVERVSDPFALRTPDRQRILCEQGIIDAPSPAPPKLWTRAAKCLRDKGAAGLLRAIGRRLRHSSGA
jgi:hypothetical protein